jgi:hypothetical protein
VQRDGHVEIQRLIVDDIAEESTQREDRHLNEKGKYAKISGSKNPQIYRSGILFLTVKKRVLKKRPSKLMKRNVAKVIKFMEDGTSLFNDNWNFILIY